MRDKYEVEDYPDACDFLARTVYEDDQIGPIGFLVKPRIRVKAGSKAVERAKHQIVFGADES